MKNRFLILCLVVSNALYGTNDKNFHMHLNTKRKNAEVAAAVVGTAAAIGCFNGIMSQAPSIRNQETVGKKCKALAINGGYLLAAIPASCVAFAFGYAPTAIVLDPTILEDDNKKDSRNNQNHKNDGYDYKETPGSRPER